MIRKVLYWLIGILVTLTAVSVILASLYEDRVSEYALNSLNSRLERKLQVEDISLSLIRQFPSASLHLSKALIPATADTTQKDTLFFAHSLTLKFSLIDLLGGEYTLRSMRADESVVDLRVASDGSNNYEFWEKGDGTGADSTFLLHINNIVFDGLRLRYMDAQANQYIACRVDELEMSGDFSKNDYSLTVSSSLLVDDYSIGNLSVVRNKPCDVDFTLQVNNQEKRYAFSKSSLLLGPHNLAVSGTIDKLEKGANMDLYVTGKNLKLQDVPRFLTKPLQDKLATYNISGSGSFELSWKGLLQGQKMPVLDAKFAVADGTFEQQDTKAKLTKTSFSGQLLLDNQNTKQELVFDTISAQLATIPFTSKLSLNGFDKPLVRLAVQGDVSLTALQEFLQVERLEKSEGSASVNARIAGRYLPDKKEFRLFNSSGGIAFEDAMFKLSGLEQPLSQMQGELILLNENLGIKGLSLQLGKSQAVIDGVLRNFAHYILLDGYHCNVEANLGASELYLDELLAASDSSNSETGYFLNLPPDVNFNLATDIDLLKFREFEAKAMKGTFIARGRSILAQKLRFKTMDGNVSTSLAIKPQGKDYIAKCSARLIDIEINKLFTQMENFGQDFIADRHLSGKMNAEVEFACTLDQTLHVDASSVQSKANLAIADGILRDFAPLQEAASYLKKHKVLNKIVKVKAFEERLKEVRFSDLKNTISIEDQQITIPNMNIYSDAMDINMEGIHGFDQAIDYKMNFRLAELLTNKHADEDMVRQEEGGIRVFMTMTGTATDPVFAYDKESKRNYKKDKGGELQEIQTILKQEFSGEAPQDSIASEKQPAFSIEWDEMDADSTSANGSKKQVSQSRFSNMLRKMGIDPDETDKKDTFDPTEDDDF